MNYYFFASLFLATFFVSFVFGRNDEVKWLPGLKFKLNFKQYSGYLQASKTRFLHYWFVESQNDPINDPLIFWFNGGPGCSSLEGLIHEMGPFQVNPDGKTLHKNPNAWNKFSSVVYIEAPAGVGFSYATDGNLTSTDDTTQEENYEAIKQFFKRYPTFRNHSTFIMGESYGGIYVPILTRVIIDNQDSFKINLKGMAIGNGLLNAEINQETQIKFMYNHGFIDELNWSKFEEICCNGCTDSCNYGNLTDECQNLLFSGSETMDNINPYDIYGTCDSDTKINNLREAILNQNLLMRSPMTKNSSEKYAGIPCMNLTDITTYLNLPSVRKALHISEKLPEWNICSNKINYLEQYNDMTPFFKKIIDTKVQVLLYYGDTDLTCNFLMAQKFSAKLGLPILEHEQAWQVDGQTGGFKTIYQGLTFTTIRGAGHMAPQFRPAPTTHAIKQFVTNQPI